MFKKLVATFLCLACIQNSIVSLFLEPSIYATPPANKLVCQNSQKDISADAMSANQMPYLMCADNAKLKIQKARLVLSSRDQCPLQYTGVDRMNTQTQCLPPYNLFMTDATMVLKALCDGKSECSFVWNQLPSLACSDGDVESLKNLSIKRRLRRIKRDSNKYAQDRRLFNKALLDIETFNNRKQDITMIYANDDDNDEYYDTEYYDEDYYDKYYYDDEYETATSATTTIATTTTDERAVSLSDKSRRFDDTKYSEEIKLMVLRVIRDNDQALNVTFTCNAKRGKFRPFSNKRFNSKFSPSLQHPLRKLSANRLKQL